MLLRCPKCHEALTEREHVYSCVNGHSYDIAREGYVNLMLANQKHSRQPGDSNDSLRSRDTILSQGVYEPLASALAESVAWYMKPHETFLDAGCGTGYYLKHVAARNDLEFYATDIAKKGVAMCAKANPQARCFVGNVFHLPVYDETLDGLMSVFCPYSGEEFARVIRKGGHVWAVTPGARHLYEVKQLVYEEPYLNEEKEYVMPGFRLLEKSKVTYKLNLNSQQLQALWRMTPYYHTTSQQGNERLAEIDEMETTADFVLTVYEKNG